ncbi:MAG TPA: TetR family transcriptional regulator [Streptomyces sp.]|nr:TetR family transcriptional regulator [Streptomyces sp.]
MASSRNTHIDEEELLDAAREQLLAVGWRRTTMTDIARRAGVSRMTVYRRWPDLATLSADLMTREFTSLATGHDDVDPAPTAAALAAVITRIARSIQGNALFRKIVEVDPELLLPYLLHRRGRTQDTLLAAVTARIERSQSTGAVRAGDPVLLARSALLLTYGFVFSSPTMADLPGTRPGTAIDGEGHDLLFDELARALEGHFA